MVIISRAKKPDAGVLSAFAIKTFYQAWGKFNTAEDMAIFVNRHFTVPVLENEMNDPHITFLLAHINSELTGYLKLKPGNPSKIFIGEHAYEIEKLYVEEQFQSKGIGALLLEEVFKSFSNDKPLWLSVWKPNERGIRFYERMGFEIIGEQEFILGTDVQYDHIMRKK